MDLCMSLQLVGCGYASNCLGVAAGANVVPYCDANSCSSAIWATPTGAFGAPAVPTLGVENVATRKSDHAFTITMRFPAERTLVVRAFIDDREEVIVRIKRC